MPRYRYYYEYDLDEDVWMILEEDGGCEHGQYYDVMLFQVPTEEDAKDAVKVLIELASKTLTKQKE